jgi:hypothetical protein
MIHNLPRDVVALDRCMHIPFGTIQGQELGNRPVSANAEPHKSIQIRKRNTWGYFAFALTGRQGICSHSSQTTFSTSFLGLWFDGGAFIFLYNSILTWWGFWGNIHGNKRIQARSQKLTGYRLSGDSSWWKCVYWLLSTEGVELVGRREGLYRDILHFQFLHSPAGQWPGAFLSDLLSKLRKGQQDHPGQW